MPALIQIEALTNAVNIKADIESLQAVLFSDRNTFILTVQDIENQVNIVRESIQSVIEDLNTFYGIDGQPVILSLQKQANLLTQLGKKLLLTSPIIITYIVAEDFEPLCLISHKLYQDFTRTDDIMRLNPWIKNPNFIMQGETLRVFAT